MKKFRWSKVYESAEEELVSLLKSKGLTPTQADLEASSEAAMTLEYTYELWCAEGSFYLTVGSSRLSMQVGDAITIPADHNAHIVAGLAGCSYYITRS